MTENAIEAVGLSKKFLMASERRTSLKERLVRGRAPEPKTFWALKDASFSVPKGSSLGLIGQNGSGKSTALKVLTGIYRPTSGRVSVNGSVSALLEVGAGFHPELTGRENIRLNATILGFTNREIDRLMDQIIEFADIGEHIDAPLKHYSSGMYVRLGFAVAVMVRPEILIVDEVIAVGDEEFQRKCYEYLFDLRRLGTSMIVVSHGLGQINELCDEAIWLERGSVRDHGPASAVTRAYIESINHEEVRRKRAEGGADGLFSDPGDGLLHRGSGEIRVTRVEFLGEGAAPTGVLISGRRAKIRLHYVATRSVPGLWVGLGFDDASDRVITGMNNTHLPDMDVPEGTGWIEFSCEQMLLAAGTYRMRINLYRGGHAFDAIDDGIRVTVRPPDVEMAGTYLQLGDWALSPAIPSESVALSGLAQFRSGDEREADQ